MGQKDFDKKNVKSALKSIEIRNTKNLLAI